MLEALATIFIIMGIGVLARSIGTVREADYKTLNSVIYYITLPALIFISLYDAGAAVFSDMNLIGANASALIAMMFLVLGASRLLRIPNKLMGILFLTSFFGNIVYMGYPLVELNFGPEGVPIVVVIATVYNLIVFSIGLAVLQYCSNNINLSEIPSHLIRNPLLLSSAAGLLYIYFSLPLPSVFDQSLRLLAHVTAPLALFSLGVFMYGRNPLANLKLNALIAFLKMAFFPALFMLIAGHFDLTGLAYEVSLLEAAMPLAVTNFILADKYQLDPGIVSSAIVLTTLISPFTLLASGLL